MCIYIHVINAFKQLTIKPGIHLCASVCIIFFFLLLHFSPYHFSLVLSELVSVGFQLAYQLDTQTYMNHKYINKKNVFFIRFIRCYALARRIYVFLLNRCVAMFIIIYFTYNVCHRTLEKKYIWKKKPKLYTFPIKYELNGIESQSNCWTNGLVWLLFMHINTYK